MRKPLPAIKAPQVPKGVLPRCPHRPGYQHVHFEHTSVAVLVARRRRLICTVRTYRPRWVAIFGVGAYRTSFAHQNAQVGQQDALGDSGVWLLPSPSGANGSHPLVISSVSFARSISQWINQRSPDTTIGHNQPSCPIVPWTGFSPCAALLSAISPMLHRLESFAIWPGNSQQ